VGSQLVSTLPTCYGEVTSHAPGQDGHNRVLPVPTVGQTVNASAEVGAWHTLAPPKRGSPATLRLAHSVPVPCGTNLGLSPFGFRVNSSAPSRNGTGWICTNLVMYLQFTRPPRFLQVGRRVELPPAPRCRNGVNSPYLPACGFPAPGDPRHIAHIREISGTL